MGRRLDDDPARSVRFSPTTNDERGRFSPRTAGARLLPSTLVVLALATGVGWPLQN